MAWESQWHCFADGFLITHAHFLVQTPPLDYAQEKCRTMSSTKLEKWVVYCELKSNYIFAWTFGLYSVDLIYK